MIASNSLTATEFVAPSRFGYLKAPVPNDYSPAAQADAHVVLLDFFDIKRAVVVGVSAGAPSAIEIALRHPERVTSLVSVVPAHLSSDTVHRR